MPRTTANSTAKVKVDIRPELVSLTQKTAWRKFWQRLIAEVKADDSR